jgi:hypothetical protein
MIKKKNNPFEIKIPKYRLTPELIKLLAERKKKQKREFL